MWLIICSQNVIVYPEKKFLVQTAQLNHNSLRVTPGYILSQTVKRVQRLALNLRISLRGAAGQC